MAPILSSFKRNNLSSPYTELANTWSFADLPHAVWRANQMGSHTADIAASGYAALDRQLPGGGWPASVLIELLMAQPGIGELRLLAPVLARLTRAGKTVILMAPPHLPFAPALAELGIDLTQVLLVQAARPTDRIWAVEQALKNANFGALLCWLPAVRSDHLRRLQLAASGADGLTFVFRDLAARDQPSPAPLRLVCQPSRNGQLAVSIIKRRGPVFAQPIELPLLLPAPLQALFDKRARLKNPVHQNLNAPSGSSEISLFKLASLADGAALPHKRAQ